MAVRLSTGTVNALGGGGAGDGSFKDVFVNAVIAVYTGLQPENANAAETGTLVGYITKDAGPFVPSEATNGLNWDAAVEGVNAKPAAEEWSIVPLIDATAGWARVYDNAMVTGLSTVAKRFDLTCGVGVGELRWSTTQFKAGVKMRLDELDIITPKS